MPSSAYKEYALLTGYRQRVDEPLRESAGQPDDPNTFEGVMLTGIVGPVDYAVGYLTAIKTRNADTFIDMAQPRGSRRVKIAGSSSPA